MHETWYYIIAEFKALGLRCVAYGPEFWLVVPPTLGVILTAALVWRGIRKGWRR